MNTYINVLVVHVITLCSLPPSPSPSPSPSPLNPAVAMLTARPRRAALLSTLLERRATLRLSSSCMRMVGAWRSPTTGASRHWWLPSGMDTWRCVRMCVRACVLACVCVRACVGACVRACAYHVIIVSIAFPLCVYVAQIVEWLLGHISHLPSEPECHKSLMAPTGDKEVLLPLRSKCLDMIMKVCSLSWPFRRAD